MKAIQTFWTCGRSLLEHNFWWYNPQCHLMSWALSCLSLHENYDEVILYTDVNGYKVFGELLQLPYTDIIVQYEGLSCPEPHWAYPKMLTYSLQQEPFIHVDGDVFLPFRLNPGIESAGLIAQNREKGSDYYKSIMNDVLRRNLILPGYLREALMRESIPSYNAGVLGGNDLYFLHEYCQIAFRIMEENRLLESCNSKVCVNNNILLEQILFAVLAEVRHRSVATVIEGSVRDNGYSYGCFCNFYKYDFTQLMHLIGGHKRNPRVCDMLGKILLDKYPEYYRRIVALFPQNNLRFQNETLHISTPDMSVQMCIAHYQDYLCSLFSSWNDLKTEELYLLEKRLSAYPHFLNAKVEVQKTFVIGKNPYLSLFEIPSFWPEEAGATLRKRINPGRADCPDVSDIVCIPCLLGKGYKELLISDLCYNILILLNVEMSFGDLYDRLRFCFSPDVRDNEESVYRMVMTEIEYLCYSGQIYAYLPS